MKRNVRVLVLCVVFCLALLSERTAGAAENDSGHTGLGTLEDFIDRYNYYVMLESEDILSPADAPGYSANSPFPYFSPGGCPAPLRHSEFAGLLRETLISRAWRDYFGCAPITRRLWSVTARYSPYSVNLSARKEWYTDVQDAGRHKGDRYYEFRADAAVWTLPSITAYTPLDETVIKELTVNFDDHSYTDKMYRKYEEMCFYTLKVFFPDMSGERLTELYKEVIKKAYDNIFPNEQGFHSGHPPSDLYYRGGTGVYPYFAYGESVRMCIIPVTEREIGSYKKKGVRIHKWSG